MTLTVLDASVFASWFLPSQRTAAADRLLDDLGRRRLIAPHIFPLEIRNLLLKAERKGARIAQSETALLFVDQAPIEIIRMDDPIEMRTTMGVARAGRLSMFDALYLRLAISEHAELATRDKALLVAAADQGVQGVDAND